MSVCIGENKYSELYSRQGGILISQMLSFFQYHALRSQLLTCIPLEEKPTFLKIHVFRENLLKGAVYIFSLNL